MPFSWALLLEVSGAWSCDPVCLPLESLDFHLSSRPLIANSIGVLMWLLSSGIFKLFLRAILHLFSTKIGLVLLCLLAPKPKCGPLAPWNFKALFLLPKNHLIINTQRPFLFLVPCTHEKSETEKIPRDMQQQAWWAVKWVLCSLKFLELMKAGREGQ